jgi:ubiquinone/menaquinone biosynthesis C-methylase UbiE
MDNNPQAKQMGDESMVRNLDYQARAIWPQEAPLFDRYDLPPDPAILDVGCGPGEICVRLSDRFPTATVTGVDLLESHLALARERYGDRRGRLRFETADAFSLPAADGSVDLAVARHVLQAVPDPARAVREMRRVLRPGGWIHVLAEDYSMMHFHPVTGRNEEFWHDGAMAFAEATRSDLRSGRKMFSILRAAGFADITVDYVVVDTQRVPREVFAGIWKAWRDGYSEAIVEHTRFTAEEVATHWRDMIRAIEDPDGFGVWFIPVLAGRVPE